VDSGRYDGGTPGIPGGISGDVERVLVVGAGIAGLAAANALTHAGVECGVLEARDRAGGRPGGLRRRCVLQRRPRSQATAPLAARAARLHGG